MRVNPYFHPAPNRSRPEQQHNGDESARCLLTTLSGLAYEPPVNDLKVSQLRGVG